MLICAFGTPGELTLAGINLLKALMQERFGAYHWISASTADDLAEAWTGRQQGHTLLFADIPDVRVTRLLVESGARFVLFLERPADIVRSLATRRAITDLAALRLASQSLATLHDLCFCDGGIIIGPEQAAMPAAALGEKLNAHFGGAPSSRQRDQMLKILTSMAPTRTEPRLRDLAPALPAKVAPVANPGLVDLAADALQGYEHLLAGHAAHTFSWPSSVFLSAEEKGAPVAGPISLMGGARCFLYGPYFHLPAGRWKATADFSVADNGSGNRLKLDVFTDQVVFEGSCPLPAQGSFRLSVTFEVTEPRLPVQLRFFNEDGAIEGQFDLHEVSISRVSGDGLHHER